MNDSRVKFGQKKFKKETNSSWINGFVKPATKFWKRYFAKKRRATPLDRQVTDDNWWEWC